MFNTQYTYEIIPQREPSPVQWEPTEEQPKPLPPPTLLTTLVNRLTQQLTS